ncbi:MAG TPA: phosphoribosyl-AMP cyclohydrolase [Acidimicrobiales bacterium]|nr:phosphoribosyl-AMP cyclohydrolase [Acidimicrobiales bacterium]
MSTAPEATGLTIDDEVLDQVRFGPDGLVVAVVQDAVGGDVLQVSYMNDESLRRTLESGRTWFWSRSRQELWCKGETSGDRQYVRELRVDCDGDALLVVVDQHGEGACHTRNWSCFYRTAGRGPGRARPDGPGDEGPGDLTPGR